MQIQIGKLYVYHGRITVHSHQYQDSHLESISKSIEKIENEIILILDVSFDIANKVYDVKILTNSGKIGWVDINHINSHRLVLFNI